MDTLKKGIPMSKYFEMKKEQENKEIIYTYGGAVVCAASANFDKLDSTGYQLLDMAQKVCFWVVAISAVYQVIKAAANGDKHKVGEVLISAGIIYGSIYLIPMVLELIRDTFGG